MAEISHSDLVLCLESLRPGASWNLDGDTLDKLVWEDTSEKPTIEEIQDRLQTLTEQTQETQEHETQLKEQAVNDLMTKFAFSEETAKVIVGL